MTTDTPRTDRVVLCARSKFGSKLDYETACECELSEMLDHARQLERELNDANAKLAAYKEALRVTQDMLSRICR